MDNIPFRKMLTDIAQGVTENDLKAMKFNCTDFIPKRRQEDIESAFDLWEALEERDKLSAEDTTFLKYLLGISTENRTDLLNILEKYEFEKKNTTGNVPSSERKNNQKGFETDDRDDKNHIGEGIQLPAFGFYTRSRSYLIG